MRAPPAHFDRICGLRSKKTAQGHRSCRRTFGGVDHRAHDGAVAAHHECEPLSIEPTALPLRSLSQFPGIQAPSDRNVALKTEGCVPDGSRVLTVHSTAPSYAPSPSSAFENAPGRIITIPTPMQLQCPILRPAQSPPFTWGGPDSVPCTVLVDIQCQVLVGGLY
jgi:hypothetical protein